MNTQNDKDIDVNDLMNRLRGIYSVGKKGEYGTRSFADFVPPISLKAANALQSLIAENEKLKHDLDNYIKRDSEHLTEIEELKRKIKCQ